MSFFHSLLSSISLSPDTTPDGKQAFLIIGDSISGDSSSSSTLGPTTLSDTCYLWNGSSLTEKTTLDINNAGSTYGSAWKKFALDYNANTSKKVVFINRAAGGSTAYPDGDNNNWYTSGDKYSPAVSDANAALSFLGITKLKGIFIILGINDASGSQSTADIFTGLTSLITRLNSDFPDTNIYISSIGRASSGVIGTKIATIKAQIKSLSETYSNVHIPANLTSLVGWNMYAFDNLHPNQTGYNKIGELYARYFTLESYSKRVRQAINAYYTDITTPHKTAIETFIEGCISDDVWDSNYVESCQIYKCTEAQEDLYVDLTLMTAGQPNGTIGFSAGNYVSTPGTAGNYFKTNFAPANSRFAGQNDFLSIIKFGTVTTPAGTAGHGHSEGGTNRLFQTSGSLIAYGANDATATTWTAGDTKFADNTEYAHGRDGGSKYLYKDTTQVHTASVASTTHSTDDILLGQARSSTAYLNAEHLYHVYTKKVGFDHAAFKARMDTLLAAW